MNEFIPVLPDSAPFTAEQRAYLNGFFAGIFSRIASGAAPDASVPTAKPLVPLTIFFGSQTGNAENLSKRTAKEAGKRGFAPTVHDLCKYDTAQLVSEQRLLVVTSTFGDGEPPDNAKAFWQFLSSESAPELTQTKFSVLALGDSNYPKFCAFGQGVDARLEALGASRVHPCVECDVEYEEPFGKWLAGALSAFGSVDSENQSASFPLTPGLPPREKEPGKPPSNDAERATRNPAQGGILPPPAGEDRGEGEGNARYSRAHPFPARLLANVQLNGPGSAKDTRHFEFSLEGSGLNYEAGDALGVRATNCAELAEELLRALSCSGEEPVPNRDGKETALREALIHYYEITRIPQPLLKVVAERSGDATLQKLALPGANGELTKFLWGREIVDLLHAHPSAKFAPTEFVALLKKLQPRLYSISSSPKAHPGQVHLCVGVVRYDSLGRSRKGVCSTFLAERVPTGGVVPVFVHHNKNFRPPANPDTPMIMVGPGTGIAPFRAFLEERRASGAKGKNWLLFGDQRAATDFLFREEIEAMQREGTLARIDLAFSRDQAEKVYVQNRMTEQAQELYAWLEEGGGFYVCGDASRMAKDVDAALHQVIQTAGGKTADQAMEYVANLKSTKRYQRDVY